VEPCGGRRNFTCTAPPPPTRPKTPRLAIGADEHRAAFAAASTGFQPLAGSNRAVSASCPILRQVVTLPPSQSM
jgi:hypothetical protein